MMDYFSPIPEGQAIITTRGVFRQTPLFERGGKVYAKYGQGYVRLLQGGTSSHQSIRWLEIDAGDTQTVERQGYLSVVGHVAAIAAE